MAVPARIRRFDHLAMARALRERSPSSRTLLVAGDDGTLGADEVDLRRLCGPAPLPEDAIPAPTSTPSPRTASTAPATWCGCTPPATPWWRAGPRT